MCYVIIYVVSGNTMTCIRKGNFSHIVLLLGGRYIETQLKLAVKIPNKMYVKHSKTHRLNTYFCAFCLITPQLQLHTHFAVSVTVSVCLHPFILAGFTRWKSNYGYPDRWISRINTHCHGYVVVSPVTKTNERKGDHESLWIEVKPVNNDSQS